MSGPEKTSGKSSFCPARASAKEAVGVLIQLMFLLIMVIAIAFRPGFPDSCDTELGRYTVLIRGGVKEVSRSGFIADSLFFLVFSLTGLAASICFPLLQPPEKDKALIWLACVGIGMGFFLMLTSLFSVVVGLFY